MVKNKHIYAITLFIVVMVVGLAVWGWLGGRRPYISTIIMPHHDLVADKRADTFARIADRTQDRRIILVAPNHYNNGEATVQTRSRSFSTSFGEVPVNKELLDLAKQHGAQEMITTFEIEHGIKALLPDIAQYYPGAEILPLVIKQSASTDKLTGLLDNLKKHCADCLMITSADFSHYQPYQLSELHDRLTIRGLHTLNAELLDTKAELEPMHHVWMSVYWATISGTERFVLDRHTNSTQETNEYYAEGTTHIMGWYETGWPDTPEAGVTFALTGSMSFGGVVAERFHPSYRQVFDQFGERVLWGTDLVVGSINGLPDRGKSPLAIKSVLEFLRITHLDTPYDNWFLPDNVEILSRRPGVVEGYKQKIAIFSGSAGDIKAEDVATIAQENVIIYPDWSDLGYADRQEVARQWVDAGADIVAGTGADEIGPFEIYKNRPIIYSLGSLVSGDQENTSSLILAGGFNQNTIELLPMLVRAEGYKPVLQRSTQADAQIAELLKGLEPYLVDSRGGLLYRIEK